MSKIKNIYAEEIFDSRGLPTIRTFVELSDGITSYSSVPSGSSKGKHEALELRDNDSKRFEGLGVLKAVENVNKIIGPKLIGMDAGEQVKIDRVMIEMDGTPSKSNLGANAILSVSCAAAKAGARSSLLPLFLYLRNFFFKKDIGKKIPTPIFNLIEGGKHANNDLDFQEFLLIPASTKTYREALDAGVSIYQSLRKLLMDKKNSTLVADEGGFSPSDFYNFDAFNLIREAIDRTEFIFLRDVFLGVDAAGNSFFKDGQYKMKNKGVKINNFELLSIYKNVIENFFLTYMEDPFSEDDWSAWKGIYEEFSARVLIVGDDLIATNPSRLQEALEKGAVNSIIVKPNQIGTISETMAVVEMAKSKNLKIIVSHRSGETADDFIADFAVAIGADYVKFGAPARERIIKYNRLLEIQYELSRL